MHKTPSGNGTIKLSGNAIAQNKPVSAETQKSQFRQFNFSFCFAQPLQQQSAPTQQYSSNIPTHKPSFQQNLPKYNPPPNHSNNPAQRRLPVQARGRYSTGTTGSLIPAPGSVQHHPALISPALSTTSSAQVSVQEHPKSLLAFPQSRIPSEMLKFQVRKSDADAAPSPASHGPNNPQIQVSPLVGSGADPLREKVSPSIISMHLRVIDYRNTFSVNFSGTCLRTFLLAFLVIFFAE